MLTVLYFLAFVILLCFGKFKIALIILGVTLALDILILLLRVGARATLDEDGFALRVLAGPVKLKLLPSGEEKAKKPKKPKKPKKEKPEKKREKPEAPAGEKPGPKIRITLELVTSVLRAVGELLGRLRHKLRVDKLVIRYTVASDDPSGAAMTFGYASAGIGALMPVLENIFDVRERDVGVAVSFDTDRPEIFVDAQLTLAIWEILYIALAVWPPVKALIGQLIKKGKVDKNGQASDQ